MQNLEKKEDDSSSLREFLNTKNLLKEYPTVALGKRDAGAGKGQGKDSVAPVATSRPDDFATVCDMIENHQFQARVREGDHFLFFVSFILNNCSSNFELPMK